jgi:DNA-binding response OmpR family regulator
MKALIYEQFNPLIDLYTRLFTEKGFEVFATKSLDEAWEYFQNNDVDIIIAKFEAVEAHDAPSGIELIGKIRNGDKNSDVFIIVIGHEIHKPDEIRLMEMKVFAMLRLPITKGAFDSKIDEFFVLRNHDRGTNHD